MHDAPDSTGAAAQPNDTPPRGTAPRETPPWTVVAVFDPDGTGGDFGYTVGLHELGHPELHMWARPTDGTDPGHDFLLSPQDICLGLNHYARMLVDGRLPVGSEHPTEFDAGLTTATFTVGEPVPPAEVDAFQADRDATVLPLRWELHREPEGPAEPVGVEVRRDIALVTAHWRLIGARRDDVAPLEVPEPASSDEFGPWTHAIQAAREAVWATAAAGDLSRSIDLLIDHQLDIGNWMATGAAIARRRGRTQAYEAAALNGRHDGQSLIDERDKLFEGMSPNAVECVMSHVREAQAGILQALYAQLTIRDLIDEPARSTVHDAVMAVCAESARGGFRSDGA